jgi:hypothetical protein
MDVQSSTWPANPWGLAGRDFFYKYTHHCYLLLLISDATNDRIRYYYKCNKEFNKKPEMIVDRKLCFIYEFIVSTATGDSHGNAKWGKEAYLRAPARL